MNFIPITFPHETIIIANDHIMVREEFERELMETLYENFLPTIIKYGKIGKANKYYYIYAEKSLLFNLLHKLSCNIKYMLVV